MKRRAGVYVSSAEEDMSTGGPWSDIVAILKAHRVYTKYWYEGGGALPITHVAFQISIVFAVWNDSLCSLCHEANDLHIRDLKKKCFENQLLNIYHDTVW